jgi:hypothetical protein
MKGEIVRCLDLHNPQRGLAPVVYLFGGVEPRL